MCGFENHSKNYFEQFMINYCNEKLHGLLIAELFEKEFAALDVEEIARDGLSSCPDNAQCIEMIEGSKGIFKQIDTQSCLPTSMSDAHTLRASISIFSSHSSSSHLLSALPGDAVVSSMDTKSRDRFVIRHYAGDVQYVTSNFISGNADKIDFEVLEALSRSNNPVIRFVICVKPNATKSRSICDSNLLFSQLKCHGVFEYAAMLEVGYPLKYRLSALHAELLKLGLYRASGIDVSKFEKVAKEPVFNGNGDGSKKRSSLTIINELQQQLLGPGSAVMSLLEQALKHHQNSYVVGKSFTSLQHKAFQLLFVHQKHRYAMMIERV